MEENIFGTLANDQLRLLHHRTARSGLQHQHEIYPRDPRPHQAITLLAHVGANLSADNVVCYYTTDGSEPAGSRGVAHNGQAAPFLPYGIVWDTIVGGYQSRWKVTLLGQPENTIVRYQIGAWAGDEPEVFADWPHPKTTSEEAIVAYTMGKSIPENDVGDPHRPHTFTLPIDRLKPPQWAHDAIIYHVFVDRFYPGHGRHWLQTEDLYGICGGTLWGVAEKLDYIADLGANCLWLSPVFPSPTHHGYDVTDYFHVEPRLGGDEALHQLVEAAHARGIRIILDIALNHLSNEHPYFVDARSNPASCYRDWFTFNDSPVGYRSFFGVETMPQVNVANTEARRWLLDIGRFWLREYHVDGFRLDVADGPGPDFWSDFWTACKAENPECFCFGEVVDAPDIHQQYIGRLDGLLDFQLCNALRRTFADGRWTQEELERLVARHTPYFPRDFVMLSFVDNHDMDRFVFQANGNRDALRRAAEYHLSLPNPPVIYYGTEIGLTQPKGSQEAMALHINRVPMRWDDPRDAEFRAFYRGLVRKRPMKS